MFLITLAMKIYMLLAFVLLLSQEGIAQCDPEFTSTSNLEKLTVQALNTSNDIEHIWNFGDGINMYGAGTTVTHNYYLPGAYSITHVVRSLINGCSDSLVSKINIDFQITCDAEFTISVDSLRYKY